MPCLHNSEDQINSRSAQQVSAVCFQNSLSQKIRLHSLFKVYLIKKPILDTILIRTFKVNIAKHYFKPSKPFK